MRGEVGGRLGLFVPSATGFPIGYLDARKDLYAMDCHHRYRVIRRVWILVGL